MEKYFQNINHIFLALLFVVTSCNGQVKINLPKDNISQQTSIEGGEPKIVRTQGVTSGNITCELQDIVGNLWFSTDGEGVYRFDGKSFTSFSESEGFVSYGITTIIEDKKGNIWLGTDKNGVFSYDGKVFKNYSTADGLINNSVRSILEDKEGNLWFGTRWFGLSRFDGKTFTTLSEQK